jgi:hypothetical protein
VEAANEMNQIIMITVSETKKSKTKQNSKKKPTAQYLLPLQV